MNDTMIRSEGMKVLVEKLGLVDAEKFITLLLKDQFDYTEWQKNLYNGLSLQELASKARRQAL